MMMGSVINNLPNFRITPPVNQQQQQLNIQQYPPPSWQSARVASENSSSDHYSSENTNNDSSVSSSTSKSPSPTNGLPCVAAPTTAFGDDLEPRTIQEMIASAPPPSKIDSPTPTAAPTSLSIDIEPRTIQKMIANPQENNILTDDNLRSGLYDLWPTLTFGQQQVLEFSLPFTLTASFYLFETDMLAVFIGSILAVFHTLEVLATNFEVGPIATTG